MGTRGTIAVKHGNMSVRTYNHYDSYPTWLGVRVGKFVRGADPEVIGAQLAAVELVDEGEGCPAEVLAEMKRRGVHQDVSSGSDWYAALRGAQGDIEQCLALGYLPRWTHGDSEEWGYLVDFDERVLRITAGGEHVRTVPFADLDADDKTIQALMTEIEGDYYREED